MVPPSASSNLPRRSAAAPVNAPFSWPNSSLSISSVGMAAQLTFTNGPDANGLSRWMCAASSSLPVPDSPESSTPTSDRATCVACCTACWNAALLPIIRGASPTSSRKRWFSRCRSERSSAFFTTSSTRSRASGFSRKSNAPLRVASTASRMVPCPEIITAGVGSSACLQRSQHVDAVAVGQPDVEQVQVGARPASLGVKLRRRLAHRDAVALALEDQPQRQADVRLVVHDHDVASAGHDARSVAIAAIGAAQRDAECRAAELAVDERDVAAGEQRVLLRDRQAESHAVLLERDCRLEQRGGRVGAQSRARNRALRSTHVRIGPVVVTTSTVPSGAGGLGGILQQVGQDAFHEVRARVGARRRGVEPQTESRCRDGRAAAARRAR